jgi:leucyl-tRNA synthetase
MFLGDFDKVAAWSTQGVIGVHRFLKRVHGLMEKADMAVVADAAQTKALHQCIFDVSQRIERMKFNTAVSALMEFSNSLVALEKVPGALLLEFAKLLSPFAPHLAEEMWATLGQKGHVALTAWPKADESLLTQSRMVIAVQVNGKLRHTMEVALDTPEAALLEQALAEPSVVKQLANGTPRKVIYVPGKILNLVG